MGIMETPAALSDALQAREVDGGPRRILIVSDTWRPQINGVVRTLEAVSDSLGRDGCAVEIIGPEGFPALPLPTYPEIPLAFAAPGALARRIAAFAPDAVHVATEGPLGWAARAACRRRGWAFSTAFHTRFPDYVHARLGAFDGATWWTLRRFHSAAAAVLAATDSLRAELVERGFERVTVWPRGVDLDRFRPGGPDAFAGLPRPVFAYVGRLAPEKDVGAFLALDLPGSKVVVGDGPERGQLERRHPDARFLGHQSGEALVASFASADAVVFPSRTDTFGLVLLEALACGSPVAAFPVQGPRDVIGDAPVGALSDDLRAACLAALTADRAACRAFAEGWSWDACARRFRACLPLIAQPA